MVILKGNFMKHLHKGEEDLFEKASELIINTPEVMRVLYALSDYLSLDVECILIIAKKTVKQYLEKVLKFENQ